MDEPSDAQIVAAIAASGFLFEQECASALEQMGFHVETSWPFADSDLGKSRELDLRAIRRVHHDEASHVDVFVELLVECKDFEAPLVFLERLKNTREAEAPKPGEYRFPRSRHQLELPVAPVALLLALVPTLAFGVLGYRRPMLRRSFSSLAVVALGFSFALATLVVAVSSTYAFRPLLSLRTSNWLAVATLGTYLAVIAFVGVKRKMSFVQLFIGAVVGIAPLYFIGLCVWLLAACSFADCL